MERRKGGKGREVVGEINTVIFALRSIPPPSQALLRSQLIHSPWVIVSPALVCLYCFHAPLDAPGSYIVLIPPLLQSWRLRLRRPSGQERRRWA